MTTSRPRRASDPDAAAGGDLHANVLDTLGHRISAGELTPGTVLTLDGIAREYAVSAPVVREAVRVLEAMGLVASRRRVGVTVQPRDGWNVFDPRLIRWRLDGSDRANQLQALSELRLGFEPAAAALAARRADTEQCRVLASAVSDMVTHGRAGDLEAYLAADVVFHRTLLAASGNEMLAALHEVVTEVLAGRTHHRLMPAEPNPEAIDLHDTVARAIRLADPAAAEAAMRAIIEEAAAAVADGPEP